MLAVVLSVSIGVLASACVEEDVEATPPASGVCGNSLTWTLDSAGLLTIQGTGAMTDYAKTDMIWNGEQASIKKAVIEGSVTSIGDYAFYNCTAMASITIGGSVTSIGKNAFENCTAITSVSIPDGVVSIGAYAFENCQKLATVSIPDSIASFGDYAFERCAELKYARIPDGITAVAGSLFRYDRSLETVEIEGTISEICSYAFWGCQKLSHILFPGSDPKSTEVVIPKTVTSIGDGAFGSCAMTSVVYPELASIGDNMFTYSKLTSFDIPKTVTSIGHSAFKDCASLASLEIPEGVTEIGDCAFRGCKSFKSIDIPDQVTAIPMELFFQCTSIEHIGIPDGVTSVGVRAFAQCGILEEVDLPSGVTSIGLQAFQDCKALKSLEIPNGVETIGKETFQACRSLTTMTIPDSVTTIGTGAFADCTRLESVVIPDSVTSLGTKTFRNCNALTSVNIPDSVSYLGQLLFGGCSSLKSIEIPNSVTAIDEWVFQYCLSLESIVIPDSVRFIDRWVFQYCGKLTSISFGRGIAQLSGEAFPYFAFYDEDETTQLQITASDLRGFVFKGDSTKHLNKVGVALEAHSVTYDENGGSASPPIQCDVTEGAHFTVKKYSGTKAGFAFGGWTDGTSEYMPGQSVEMGGSDIVLKAIWNPSQTGMVKYDHSALKELLEEYDYQLDLMADLPPAATGAEGYERLRDVAVFKHIGWEVDGVQYPTTHGFVLQTAHTAKSLWIGMPAVTYDHSGLVQVTGDPDSVAGLNNGVSIQGRTGYEQLPDRDGYRHVGWLIGDERVGPTDAFVIRQDHEAKSLWEEIRSDEDGGFVPILPDPEDPDYIPPVQQDEGGRHWGMESVLLIALVAAIIAEMAALCISRHR